MTTIYFSDRGPEFRIRLRSDDPEIFHLLIAGLKKHIPAHSRTYDPESREWMIRPEACAEMAVWFRFAGTFGVEVESLNEESREERTSPPQQPSAAIESALSTMCLLPKALQYPELIRQAYKTLALIHHPDRGGDLREMQALNAAYNLLSSQIGSKAA